MSVPHDGPMRDGTHDRTPGIGRRALFVTGATAALAVGTVSLAAAAGQSQETRRCAVRCRGG